MTTDYLKRILTARVYDVAEETPLEYAPTLSSRLGNRIYFKREDMQSVFSFKLRGGLDINPWRANFSTGKPSNLRTARQ